MCFASARALDGGQPDFTSSPGHLLASVRQVTRDDSGGALTRSVDLHEYSKLLCLRVLGDEVCSTLFKGVCLFGYVNGFNDPEVGDVFGQLLAFVGLEGADIMPFDFAGQGGCLFEELCGLSWVLAGNSV